MSEDVQACVIYACLRFYCWFMCFLDTNMGSDAIPVSATLWWDKHPKETSEVGNTLVEEFAPTETSRNPSADEGGTSWGWQQPPMLVLAGQRSYRTCWPSTSPTVSVNGHKLKQTLALAPVESLEGGGGSRWELYLFRECIPLWCRGGLGNAGGEVGCRVLPAPAPLHVARRLMKACLLL